VDSGVTSISSPGYLCTWWFQILGWQKYNYFTTTLFLWICFKVWKDFYIGLDISLINTGLFVNQMCFLAGLLDFKLYGFRPRHFLQALSLNVRLIRRVNSINPEGGGLFSRLISLPLQNTVVGSKQQQVESRFLIYTVLSGTSSA
jgi:hypothetical protein